MFPFFSDKFPPRNRPATNRELGVIDIVIHSGNGIGKFDPNSLSFAAQTDELAKLVPLDARLSDISGKPAVVVETDDVEIALTPDEAQRHALHALTPSEFFALAERYGVFYNISRRFYDEETGESYALSAMQMEAAKARLEENVVLLSTLPDGNTRVEFDDGLVVHAGLSADPAEIEKLLTALGFSVG